MSSFIGHSYNFYEQVIITVPIVGPFVVIPVIIVVNCVCGCLHSSHPKILYGTADMFSFSEEKKHYLQGQEKPSHFIVFLLATKAVLLLMFSLAVFLNESIIANEVGCVSGNWDCFVVTNGQATRISNCSDLGEFSDDSIQCYHPAFEYSTAISEVGGIAFVSQIVISAYIAVYFSVRFITNRCLRITSAAIIVLLFFVVGFVAPIAFASGHLTLTTTETLNFEMHNLIFGIYYPLLYIVVTLALIVRSKCTFDDFDTDYDPHTTVITIGGPTGENEETEVGGVTTPPRASVQIAQGNKVHKINVI